MSNKRKLRPPPSGFRYEVFAKRVLESELDEEAKRQILIRAAYADRKGRLKDAPR